MISEYTRVLNILDFWICHGYTRFWIKYFVIDVWQYSEYALDSEYATVLNMLGLHQVVNKIFHHRYLTGFWICENTSVAQNSSVESSPSYMFDRFLSIPWSLIMPGLEYTRVVTMPRLHMFLCKLYFKDSQYFECLEFWIS